MDLNWLDLTQIALMLLTCWACFTWGRSNGIELALEALIQKKIISERDLEKLND